MRECIAVILFFVAGFCFYVASETAMDVRFTFYGAMTSGLLFIALALFIMSRGARA